MSAASSAFSAADARRSFDSSAPLRYGISASSFFNLASALVARFSAASRAPSAFSARLRQSVSSVSRAGPVRKPSYWPGQNSTYTVQERVGCITDAK